MFPEKKEKKRKIKEKFRENFLSISRNEKTKSATSRRRHFLGRHM
jgi:hypothetical protein